MAGIASFDHISMDGVLDEVARERERQEAKWGQQNHDNFAWSAILGEEVGEACKASLECHFGHDPGIDTHGTPTDELRAELVQVAAVAVSWVEAIDRRAARG